jgi:hypothetical protein
MRTRTRAVPGPSTRNSWTCKERLVALQIDLDQVLGETGVIVCEGHLVPEVIAKKPVAKGRDAVETPPLQVLIKSLGALVEELHLLIGDQGNCRVGRELRST